MISPAPPLSSAEIRWRGLWPAGLLLVAEVLVDRLNALCPPEFLTITPWNPRPAIGLVFLLLMGFRQMPLVALSGLIVGMIASVSSPPMAGSVVIPMAEAVVYGGCGWALQRRYGFDPDLDGFDQALRFVGLIAVAAAIMAMIGTGLALLAGRITPGALPQGWFSYWVGDLVGGLVMGPFLLVNRRIWGRWGQLRILLSWECVVQAALFAAVLTMIFPRTVGSRFYPMFIPLVWIAARFGLTGVASALLPIQIVFVACISWLELPPNQMVKLQILTVTLAVTGLLLGAVISERERVRRSVIQGEARLQAIIDMAPDGMVLVDEAGRIEISNRQFEAMTDAPADRLLGRILEEMIQAPVPAGADERRIERADGSALPVEISTSTIAIGGRNTRVVAIRDISARRLAAVRLGQRRARIESASRSNLSEELAAALAHELNQPLSAVIAYTGACQRTLVGTDAPPRALEQLAKAAAQAERAGRVLRRLREFFGNSTIEPAPVALSDLVNEVLPLLADEAARLGAEFSVAIEAGLAGHIDRLQIEQVLINLLRNSLDALEQSGRAHGTITIETRLADRGQIEISVVDTGPGIDIEISDQLFRPFASTRPSGMGLGLAISRSLVEANGGQLWADPPSAAGAALRFTVPQAEGAVA